MVVAPKVKGFMCTTAHPEGCKAAVKAQIDYVKSQPKSEGPKKVLVIGASMGYGLARRIALTYSCDADLKHLQQKMVTMPSPSTEMPIHRKSRMKRSN